MRTLAIVLLKVSSQIYTISAGCTLKELKNAHGLNAAVDEYAGQPATFKDLVRTLRDNSDTLREGYHYSIRSDDCVLL